MEHQDKLRKSHRIRSTNDKKENMAIPLRKQTRRRPSDAEGSICLPFTSCFKSNYEAMMKTKFPLYLCVSVYIIICLLGNTVMALIFWKHHNSSTEITLSDNFTAHNNFLLNIDLNDSSILDSSIEFDEDFFETDDLDFYHIFINESDNEVSREKCLLTRKNICYFKIYYIF